MNNLNLAIQFFLQIAVILGACRLVGLVAKRFGQPQVVAEMIAGVLLGPSLFGMLAPEWQRSLFPWDAKQATRDTSSYLFPASQLGLALYMFIVGLEFRIDIVRRHLKSSIAVSTAGMLVPFLLGGGLGYLFHSWGGLFPERTSANEAMLFVGASMCITAFPMLARIIHFKGLQGTLMGTVAIGAGAIDDAVAWCLLALVLASFDNDPSQAIRSIVGGIAFVLIVTMVLRPLLLRFHRMFLDNAGKLSETGLVLALMLMALGAWFTDSIHLHAVFGAFLIGTAIPRGQIHLGVVDRVQPLTVALFLPLFFTYSGLNTRIGLLNQWWLLGICVAILIAAILGKWAACSLAARLSGLSMREAMGIGVLMNARGLMELIIINKGLERGIISYELFACLVIMAIVTTLMASPLFDRMVGTDPMASGASSNEDGVS
ncbi:MAG: cation:proton antiporter [Planctomycetota bacterium]